jgi:hypothetical protein
MSAAVRGRGIDRSPLGKDASSSALRHEAVWELVCVLEEVAETLWRADQATDREPDEFDRQEVEQLEDLADELELRADDLGEASGVLRRGVRRTLGQLRRLFEEAEEYIEDAESDDEGTADEDGTIRSC